METEADFMTPQSKLPRVIASLAALALVLANNSSQAQVTQYFTGTSVATPIWTQASVTGSQIWSPAPDTAPTQTWTNGNDAVISANNPQLNIGSSGNLSVSARNLTVSNSLTLLGVGTSSRTLSITGWGSGSIFMNSSISGAGSLIFSLSGTSAWNGLITTGTNASNLLQINSTASTGTSTKINMTGGRINLTAAVAGGVATIGELSGTAGVIDASSGTDINPRTLRIQQTTNTTFSGTFNSSATRILVLEKAGSGTLTLTSNANAHQGGTIVSDGTLLINNTSGSGVGTGNVSVTADGTLGGTGIIALAAGNSVSIEGKLAVGGDSATAETFDITTSGAGALEFFADSIVELDIWTNALAGSDRLVTTGFVAIAEDVTLSLLNTGGVTFVAGNEFDLFDWGTMPSGTFFELFLPTLDDGLSWNVSQLYDTGVISVVPEPTTTALLLLAGSTLLWLTKRSRGQLFKR